MSPEDFTYWMQGFAEISNTKQPSKSQWAEIVLRLGQVFDKKTPTRVEGVVDDKVRQALSFENYC